MASNPITSWQIDGETMGTMRDFILGGSKITGDGDCSHEIKRHWLLGRKAITNLHSVLKIRDITLPTKVHLVKVMVFPVVVYRCESWTIKKAEHQRIDAFEVWCWRRLLDCKEIQPVHPKGNQSWIFTGRTEAEAETLNTLATWCKQLTHWKRPWCWEGLKAGVERDHRGRDGWMASPTRWTWVWASSRSWWWARKPGVLQSMGSQKVRHNWETELNWTDWEWKYQRSSKSQEEPIGRKYHQLDQSDEFTF